MKKNVTYWLLLSVCTACGSNSSAELSPSNELATAEQAIMHLEEQDADAVKGCLKSAEACGDSSEQCTELKHECAALKGELDDARAPLVECWEQVKDCAKSGGTCRVESEGCEGREGKSKEQRDQTLGCSEIAHACAKDPNRTAGCGSTVSEECKAFHERVKAELNKGKDAGSHDENELDDHGKNDEHAAGSNNAAPGNSEHPMLPPTAKPEHEAGPQGPSSDAGVAPGSMSHSAPNEHVKGGMGGQGGDHGNTKVDAGADSAL